MRLLSVIALITSLLALSVAGFFGYKIWNFERRLRDVEDHTFSVVSTMGQFQRFTEKLYFSGAARNWRLADWYTWKLNAALLTLKEGHVGHYRDIEAYDVAELTGLMLEPVVEAFYPIIEARDLAAFRSQYQVLVETCNACHQVTEHPQIVITVPSASSFSNQSYEAPSEANE